MYIIYYISYILYIYVLYIYIYFSNSNTDVFIYSRLYRLCFNFCNAISYARKSYGIIQRKCKHRVKSCTTCTKMLRFCRQQFFPNEENEFMLTIENMSMTKTKGFGTAFSLLLCSHYVFKLSYSRNLVPSMAFFQKCIIKLPDDTAIPTKIVGFIAKIRKTGLLSF